MREELTGWDALKHREFTGQEAALAIVGEPETKDPEKLRKASTVLELMRCAYDGTRRWLADGHQDGQGAPRGLLVSVEMRTARGRTDAALEAVAGDVRFLTWLRTPMADFDRQTFARDELARWLQEVGASTQYPFAGQRPEPQPETTPPAETDRRAVKKVGLIAELGHEWASIEADLKEAKDNGLHAARVPGQRGWYYVDAARQWAEARGKLKARAAISPWTGATRVHRLGD